MLRKRWYGPKAAGTLAAMKATRPQPAARAAMRPASAVRREMLAGLSESIRGMAPHIDETVAHQPAARILRVLGEPRRCLPKPEAVTPFIHIAAHALGADVRQRFRQDQLQVAHRGFLRVVAA